MEPPAPPPYGTDGPPRVAASSDPASHGVRPCIALSTTDRAADRRGRHRIPARPVPGCRPAHPARPCGKCAGTDRVAHRTPCRTRCAAAGAGAPVGGSGRRPLGPGRLRPGRAAARCRHRPAQRRHHRRPGAAGVPARSPGRTAARPLRPGRCRGQPPARPGGTGTGRPVRLRRDRTGNSNLGIVLRRGERFEEAVQVYPRSWPLATTSDTQPSSNAASAQANGRPVAPAVRVNLPQPPGSEHGLSGTPP